MFGLTEEDKIRFLSYVDKKSDNQCWVWTAYKQSSGHGQFRIREKNHYAHRIAYYLAYGLFDDSLCVCHKCDNPSCCNPNHMFLGTLSDNMKDKIAKGRNTRGTAVNGVLLEEDVYEIKRLYATGEYTQKQIAKRFGIHQCNVGRIISGRRWGHLGVKSSTQSATDIVATNDLQGHVI